VVLKFQTFFLHETNERVYMHILFLCNFMQLFLTHSLYLIIRTANLALLFGSVDNVFGTSCGIFL